MGLFPELATAEARDYFTTKKNEQLASYDLTIEALKVMESQTIRPTFQVLRELEERLDQALGQEIEPGSVVGCKGPLSYDDIRLWPVLLGFTLCDPLAAPISQMLPKLSRYLVHMAE